MAEAAKAQEPSMEEILASIRRIIADDDTKPAAPRPAPAAAPPEAAAPPPPPEEPAPPPPEPEPEPPPEEVELPAAAMAPEPPPEVLDLTEDMTAMAEVPAFRTIDSEPDVVFAEPEPEPEASAPEPEPLPEPPPVSAERLLSGSATAAVDSAFNSLAQTVLLHNARTLEDLVREMLRPMLKTWLDDNLPGMVERLVRAEIERVSRGRS
jgi:cell pole-organizing protein PopZ